SRTAATWPSVAGSAGPSGPAAVTDDVKESFDIVKYLHPADGQVNTGLRPGQHRPAARSTPACGNVNTGLRPGEQMAMASGQRRWRLGQRRPDRDRGGPSPGSAADDGGAEQAQRRGAERQQGGMEPLQAESLAPLL